MKRIFLILILMLVPFAVSADDLGQLRKDAANIKTLQAGFIQKKQLKILSRPLVSEGRFFYAAPDSLRWEYVKPLRSIVISNKGETRRYIVSGGKITEDKSGSMQAMRIVLNEIINWMSGKFDRNPAFTVSLKEGVNTLITLIPVESSMTGMIERIEISYSKKNMSVKSVKIIEGANAATIIDFNHVEINKAINEKIFQEIE